MNIRVIKMIILLLFLPMAAFGQVRGISVSPSEIIVDGNGQWPYVTDIQITNTGDSDEWVEIGVFGDTNHVRVSPSRFPLKIGETGRTVITVSLPTDKKVIGNLQISATRNSPEGATVGTGIKLPFVISSQALTAGDMNLAAAAGTGSASKGIVKVFGITIILLFVALVVGRVSVRMARNWDNG